MPLDMTQRPGGFGITPWGQCEWGNSKSDLEARFEESFPVDGQANVDTLEWTRFTVYTYSSWLDEKAVKIEISEDSGETYTVAYEDGVFKPPYDEASNRVRRPDGHRLSFWIRKTDAWVNRSKIILRFTGSDEFGQEATKVIPVVWS